VTLSLNAPVMRRSMLVSVALPVPSALPPVAVQTALRNWFSRWGLPAELRVDNGYPWGSSGDLPPALALWLIGLGVSVSWNPPRRPTANAKIERTHGLADQWAEPERCATLTQLQAQLDWASQLQREHYPAVHGNTRWSACPDLAHSGRHYAPADEGALWQVGRVHTFLGAAEQHWTRRVSVTGQISLYNQNYMIGRCYARQSLSVRFDPQATAWQMRTEAGELISTHPARQLTPERICSLTMVGRPSHPGA
jgi:hypothetical protein